MPPVSAARWARARLIEAPRPLLAIGVVLWLVTVLVIRRGGGSAPRLDPT